MSFESPILFLSNAMLACSSTSLPLPCLLDYLLNKLCWPQKWPAFHLIEVPELSFERVFVTREELLILNTIFRYFF